MVFGAPQSFIVFPSHINVSKDSNPLGLLFLLDTKKLIQFGDIRLINNTGHKPADVVLKQGLRR